MWFTFWKRIWRGNGPRPTRQRAASSRRQIRERPSTSMFDIHSLNPQQRAAVQATEGPVLILAGAGTGKTRVITCRIVHLMSQGIAPENILGVTFTNKAAREMMERVKEMMPSSLRKSKGTVEKPQRPVLCTFHSLCVRILREHIHHIGYKANFVIYDESEQIGTLRKILSQISGLKGIEPREVLAAISRIKNTASKEGAAPDEDPVRMRILERYQKALHACNAVDFDDLILLTLRLFKGHPNALEACRMRFRYIMVDEYQDTNASQFALVQYLSAKHRNLCVVGDDDQSIYGWRGAEIGNLLNLEDHFPEVKVVKLEQNYRSTNVILEAANAVIQRNARRRPKKLWSDNGRGAPISMFAFVDDDEEARVVVEEIEFNRMARQVAWREHAILFRTNAQSRPLETALRKAGVRYHLVGGQSFFDRREIRDFLAYLKMFVNPNDDNSLLRIANVPPRGLSDGTMEKLLGLSQERQSSVFSVMRHTDMDRQFSPRTAESLRDFVSFVERTRAQLIGSGNDEAGFSGAHVSLKEWALGFLDEVEYWAELRKMEKTAEAGENRVRNIRDLVSTMDGDTPGGPPDKRLETFLADIVLDGGRETEKETTQDAVTLITMHSCKGLEFPHVFVVGVEDGLLPHTNSKETGNLDEERRLFYVAMTRAMKTLSVSHCGGRRKYGTLMPCHPSPFLEELPDELIQDGSERAKKPVTTGESRNLFASMREFIG